MAIRTAQAKSAYYRLNRLANTEKGLSPLALRQLYIACVNSIADYGSVIWWRGQEHFKKPLQLLQNVAIRKILGVFKTAPIRPMEVEAALAPPHIRLNNTTRQYAFRALKLSPRHPIPVQIAQTLATIPRIEINSDIYNKYATNELAIEDYYQGNTLAIET